MECRVINTTTMGKKGGTIHTHRAKNSDERCGITANTNDFYEAFWSKYLPSIFTLISIMHHTHTHTLNKKRRNKKTSKHSYEREAHRISNTMMEKELRDEHKFKGKRRFFMYTIHKKQHRAGECLKRKNTNTYSHTHIN